MKKAIILDLDNTIYPVSSISSNLFAKVYEFIDSLADELGVDTVKSVKDEMTRRPYQHVADQYNFSEAAKNKGADILKNLEYDKPMQPFDDYQHIRDTQIEKYLVTTGFTKLQWSKVKLLGIEADFKAIYIVDPQESKDTKKDIFARIMKENGYTAADLLIIGDDPESEIKAATALGIDTFLFDPEGKHSGTQVTYSARSLKDAVILFT